MAISKSAAIAGVLGTGGGAVGTVATVKYVTSTSKEETVSNNVASVEQPTGKTSPTISSNPVSNEGTADEQLAKVKKEITDWANEKGKCTIKIKKTGDSEQAQELNNFQDKDVLDSLLKFLKGDNSKTKAETECGKKQTNEGAETHAELTLTQKENNDDWDITNSITTQPA